MRKLHFASSALLLLVLLLLAWMFRYERAGDGKVWTLADMRPVAGDSIPTEAIRTGQQVTLSAQATEGGPNRFLVLELPECGVVDALHLKYRIRCDDVVPGEASWYRGRIAIHWVGDARKQDGENHPLHDFSGDGVIEMASRVVAPTHAPAIPRIMFQHMARSGSFTVEELEVCAVRERTLWKWARVGLIVVGSLWFFLLFRALGLSSWAASCFLSLVCIAMIIAIIVPKDSDIKPQLWGMTYQLGSKHASSTRGPGILPGALQPSQAPSIAIALTPYTHGTIKTERSIIVWIKMRLHRFLPLLHVLVFLAPTLAIALLVGIRPAALIACSFAFASESSQLLFGDVWDRGDLMDLLLNLAGVGMGLLLIRYFHVYRRSLQVARSR